MIKRILLAALLAVAAPASVSAQSAIAQARAAGAAGERFDGYLGIASGSGDALRRTVGTINLKRRALYSNLAARRGVSPQEVGISAACQLFRRVAVGESYLLQDGVWRRRGPGDPAPHPSYCG